MRVVNAAPGAPPLDVFIDNSSTPFATVAFGETSPFVDVDSGDITLVVRVAGTDTVVFETATIVVTDDDTITAIAAGDIASADPASSFRILPEFDNFEDDVSSEARVRFVNAVLEVPAIGIDIGNDGTVEVAALPRFESTNSDGIAVPAATDLQIGVLAGGQPFTAFTTPALPGRGEVYFIETGFPSEQPRLATSLTMLTVDTVGTLADVEQNPTTYMLAASPDAPPVDVRANGVLIFSNLAFSNLMPVQLPPGDYALTFSPAGNPDVALASAQLIGLAAGQRYLAVMSGELTPEVNEARFNVTTFADQFLIDDVPRLRAINSSPDSPVIDISTLTGAGQLVTPPLFTELAFQQASAGEGQLVGSTPALTLGVAPTKTINPFAIFNVNTIGAPHEFAITAGDLAPGPNEQFYRLFLVNTLTNPWSITTSFEL